MNETKIKFSAFLVQFLATFVVAYLTTLIGFVYAWPSYTVEILSSDDTPLAAPMSSTEIYLLGSLTNIGALLASPFCGAIIDKLGRRRAAMLFGLPFVFTWTLISITSNINVVLFSMFFAGFGAAGQVVSSVYISEIVQDSIRGGLTTSTIVGYFAGVLISYVLGGSMSYHQVVLIHLFLSILYVVMLLFLKESPVYLVQKGKEEDAAKSIAFYRQISIKSKEVEVELNGIKRLIDPYIEEMLQNENGQEFNIELLKKENNRNGQISMSPWTYLMKSPSSQRALFSCLFLMTVVIFMGTVVLQVYAEPLFKEAVPSLPPNLCAIFLAFDFLIASFISAFLTDMYGRKPLTAFSSAGAGVCTLLLGLQLHLQFAPHWFTAFIIYAYCFVYSLGAASTPIVIAAEVFLPEVRSLCNSIVLGCMWLVNFVVLIIFHPIVEAIGLGPMYYIFSCACFLTAFYCFFYLPETKGLPADAIQLLFYKKKRKSLVLP